MAPEELPIRCLAVGVLLDPTGQIDGLELEALMNEIAGVGQWMSTEEWLFVEPPRTNPEQITVPVALPESIAVKVILADLTNDPPRILSDHAMTPAEIRRWRWLTFHLNPNPQGQGLFPWEVADV